MSRTRELGGGEGRGLALITSSNGAGRGVTARLVAACDDRDATVIERTAPTRLAALDLLLGALGGLAAEICLERAAEALERAK